jgi:hypothetical protein
MNIKRSRSTMPRQREPNRLSHSEFNGRKPERPRLQAADRPWAKEQFGRTHDNGWQKSMLPKARFNGTMIARPSSKEQYRAELFRLAHQQNHHNSFTLKQPLSTSLGLPNSMYNSRAKRTAYRSMYKNWYHETEDETNSKKLTIFHDYLMFLCENVYPFTKLKQDLPDYWHNSKLSQSALATRPNVSPFPEEVRPSRPGTSALGRVRKGSRHPRDRKRDQC